jgi:hypothetical protein
MSEATLILPNMRGGCATVGNTVHTLFRVSSRKPRPMANGDSAQQTDRGETANAQSQASA